MHIILKNQPLFGYFLIPILTSIVVSSFLCSLAYAMIRKEIKEIERVHVICPINILIVLSVVLIFSGILINIYICFNRYNKPCKLIV
jgi:hypothetical protein